jgi:hypothetical protein
MNVAGDAPHLGLNSAAVNRVGAAISCTGGVYAHGCARFSGQNQSFRLKLLEGDYLGCVDTLLSHISAVYASCPAIGVECPRGGGYARGRSVASGLDGLSRRAGWVTVEACATSASRQQQGYE